MQQQTHAVNASHNPQSNLCTHQLPASQFRLVRIHEVPIVAGRTTSLAFEVVGCMWSVVMVVAAATLVSAFAVDWRVLQDTQCYNAISRWRNIQSLEDCHALCIAAGCGLVTYCPGSGCSATETGKSRPLTCWTYSGTQLSACVRRVGWVSALRLAPSDWQQRVSASNMAFTTDPANVIGIGLFPVTGNGFLAIEQGPYTQSPHHSPAFRGAGNFYMAGVFNGQSWKGPSHRAQIPKLHSLSLLHPPGPAMAIGVAIDFERGVYYNRTLFNATYGTCPNTVVEQRAYAHRAYRDLYVYEFAAFPAASGNEWTGCTLPVSWSVSHEVSEDVRLTQHQGSAHTPTLWVGSTVIPEEPDTPTRRVAVAFDQWVAHGPTRLSFTRDNPLVRMTVVLRSDLDTPSGQQVDRAAAASWQRYAGMSSAELMAAHTSAWAELWTSGGVEISGNATLASIINASLYDILSSLRDDWNWSSSPGGLGTNGYCGHVFWDMETWVHPVLTALYPSLARSALQYRLDRLQQSLNNAIMAGYKGAMWAWESAFTGGWTGPWRKGDMNEHHISADIPLAMRKFFYTTNDLDFLREAWPALNATCTFWECRFRRINSKYPCSGVYSTSGCSPKDGIGNWSVWNVVPPDEGAGITNDCVYTNAAAAQTLAWCIEAAQILRLPPTPAIWADMAASPYLPLTKKLTRDGAVHLQDSGYDGGSIHQADVALLQYPLGLVYDADVMRRDLDYYATRTDFAGMFTGDASYTCAYLALGDKHAADAQFDTVSAHLSRHFHVFTETGAGNQDGRAQHFITGSAGLLQMFIFCYSGMRVERLGVISFSSRQPVVPPLGVTAVKLRGVHLLGSAFDFWWDGSTVCVNLHAMPTSGMPQLEMRADGRNFTLGTGQTCVALQALVVAGVGF